LSPILYLPVHVSLPFKYSTVNQLDQITDCTILLIFEGVVQ